MTEQEQLEILERRLRAAFATVSAPPSDLVPLARPAAQSAKSRRRSPRLVRWAPLAAAMAVALVAGLLLWHVRTPRELPSPGRSASAAVWKGHGLVITARAEASLKDCRLPVTVLATGAGGFVQLGHGTPKFTPASGGGTYVPALNTWADVFPQDVAPSGDAYVEVIPTYGPQAHNTLRIVWANGTSSTLQPPQPTASVLAWTREGILVTWFNPSKPPGRQTDQAWLLDPSTGATRPVPFTLASTAGEYLPADDSLWGEAPAGTSLFGPVQGSSSMWAGGLIIFSQSMATGAVQEWLESSQSGVPLNNQQGPLSQVVATTAGGEPIIQIGSSDLTHLQPNQQNGVTEETLLLTSPDHATVLNQGTVGSPGVAANLSPLSVTSGGTVWMADDQGGIWTYTQSGGMREVARIRTTNDGSPGVSISGPCE